MIWIILKGLRSSAERSFGQHDRSAGYQDRSVGYNDNYSYPVNGQNSFNGQNSYQEKTIEITKYQQVREKLQFLFLSSILISPLYSFGIMFALQFAVNVIFMICLGQAIKLWKFFLPPFCNYLLFQFICNIYFDFFFSLFL